MLPVSLQESNFGSNAKHSVWKAGEGGGGVLETREVFNLIKKPSVS